MNVQTLPLPTDAAEGASLQPALLPAAIIGIATALALFVVVSATGPLPVDELAFEDGAAAVSATTPYSEMHAQISAAPQALPPTF